MNTSVALVLSDHNGPSSQADVEQTGFCSPACSDWHRLSFVWSVFLKTVKVTLRLLQLPLRLLLSVVNSRSVKEWFLKRSMTIDFRMTKRCSRHCHKTDGCHLGLAGDGSSWPTGETAPQLGSLLDFWFASIQAPDFEDHFLTFYSGYSREEHATPPKSLSLNPIYFIWSQWH